MNVDATSSLVADEPILSIEGLQVAYGRREVLAGLDLAIDRGEIFGLLGPNGVGKTTLIRAICGRVAPRSGMIRIAGIVNSDRRALRAIGLVPQEIALYGHLTARENLQTFGRLSGLSRLQTEEAMAFAIEAVKLDSHLNVPVHRLSGGWKRRVNIAAAVLHKPTLLILDEPTVGVDVDARHTLHAVIRDLSRSGLAVLISTHDLDQAQTLCSRIGFLQRGGLSPVGNPDDLLQATFGDKTELILTLREPVSPLQRQRLEALKLTEDHSLLEWRGLISGSNGLQGQFYDAFQRSDLPIKEVRFHAPGLDSLFLTLSHREAAA